MKKIISCMLLFAMLFSFAIAGASFAEEKKISVVTTIFPIYAWVREGLPALRHGEKGDIQSYYQDYVHWMIECARLPDCKVKNVPVWAYWFVRADGWKRPLLQ